MATRCSTARNGYIARCCQGPLVRAEPCVVRHVHHHARATVHELPEELGEDAFVTDHDAERGWRTRKHDGRGSPAPDSEMNSAQPLTNPIRPESGTYSPNGTRWILSYLPDDPLSGQEKRAVAEPPGHAVEHVDRAHQQRRGADRPRRRRSVSSSSGSRRSTVGDAVSGHTITVRRARAGLPRERSDRCRERLRGRDAGPT